MSEINWREFINLEYWLEGIAGQRGADNPQHLIIQSDSGFFWAYLVIFATFIIIAILLKTFQSFLNRKHPISNQIPVWATNIFLMGFLGFVWFFFREINVDMLNSRVWILVGIVWIIIFTGFVIRYFWQFFPFEINAYNRHKLKKF